MFKDDNQRRLLEDTVSHIPLKSGVKPSSIMFSRILLQVIYIVITAGFRVPPEAALHAGYFYKCQDVKWCLLAGS